MQVTLIDKPDKSVKTTEMTNDPVNHPAHYTAADIEVIDFLEAWNASSYSSVVGIAASASS